MNEQDLKSLALFYCGKSKLYHIWHKEIQELHQLNAIKKIYEVYDKGFLGAWYMVVDNKNHKYIVKHAINDVNTSFMMMQFSNHYDFIRVDSSILSNMNLKKSA